MNEIHTEIDEENTDRIRNNYTDESISGHSIETVEKVLKPA